MKGKQAGRILAGLAGLAALALAGCEQTVKRTLPSNFRTIAVREFQNNTDQVVLPTMLREELRREFRMDGRVGVSDDTEAADGVLYGAIVEYTRQPARFDQNNVIQEYRLRAVVDLSLTDGKTGKLLWTDKGPKDTAERGGTLYKLERYVNFVVVPASGLAVETEQDAQRRMVRDLARDIVLRVIEGW